MSSRQEVVSQSFSNRDVDVVVMVVDVPKVSTNNCEGIVSSKHEVVSQSLSKRDVDVVVATVDVNHT